jgi:O-antigen ligase
MAVNNQWAEARTSQRYNNRTNSGLMVAGLVSLALGLPIYLPIPGWNTVPILAQLVGLGSVVFLLPTFLFSDLRQKRAGSALRLAVFGMTLAASLSWGFGTLQHGLSARATFSLLNWITLGALVILGQVLFGTPRRIRLMLGAWTIGYSLASIVVLAYLAVRFGSELLSGINRTPFQKAGRLIFPSWPTYFGLSLSVGVCILWGRVRTGGAGTTVWAQLAVHLLALFFSFSRGTWLAAVSGFVVMSLASGPLRKRLPVLLLSVGLILPLAYRLPAVRYQVAATMTAGSVEQLSVLKRAAFAQEAILVWGQSPLLGIGFRGFNEVASQERVNASGVFPYVEVGSVHNDYLTTLVKGGLLGALTLVIILVIAGISFYRHASDDSEWTPRRELGIVSLGILTVLAVGALGAEAFRSISVSALFWLLAGGLAMVPRRVQSDT